MTEKILIDRNSRYRDTILLKDTETKNLYFDLWESTLSNTLFADTISDIEHTVTNVEIGCLDLIALDYYNNERLWWVVAWFNGIIDPIEEMKANQIIIIPNPAKVREWLK